ncbi:MAG: thioredoxin fold domain-containing protein [Saprospiraceae bacterium]
MLSLLFCTPFLALAGGEASLVNFYKGDLSKVQETAVAQGKLYFYNFEASWCTPCHWMDEKTYTDPALAAYIADNYVAAKVDIDEFEGFALKEKYKVQKLPTIIVFSQDGKILVRFEESLSSAKFLSILKKYRTENNETTINAGITESKVIAAKSTDKTAVVSKVKEGQSSKEAVEESPEAAGNFAIQLISLGQYENAVKTCEELKKSHENQPVVIRNDQDASGKKIYKIMVGAFKSRNEAEKYRQSKAAKGFVKDLSTL